MSSCPEPAAARKDRERQIRRSGWTCDPFRWGSVEQALHSHQKVEELLFHAVVEAMALAVAFFFSAWKKRAAVRGGSPLIPSGPS